MPPRALVLVACTAALGATLAGCGTYSDSDRAAGALATFLAACGRDQPALATETLVPAGRTAFIAAGSTVAGCGRILRVPAGDATAAGLRAARLVGLERDSLRATGRVDVAGHTTTVQLDLTPDGWRLEGPS